ncbi:hypothetical protein D9M68_607560 [compost metagenome]
MPGHADEQAAVVAPVGRPPVLAVGHERGQVLLERGKVQLPEGFGVVKVGVHRIGRRGVLVQDAQVQLVGPPVGVGLGTLCGAGASGGMERALGFGVRLAHGVLL